MAKQVKKALDAKPEDGRLALQSYMVEGVCWLTSTDCHPTSKKYNKKFTLLKESVYVNLSKCVQFQHVLPAVGPR